MKRALSIVLLLLASSSFAQFIPIAYWEFQHPEPQGNNLRAVKMIDSLTYIAVGDDGTVVRTSDDGTTWKVTSRITGFQGTLTSVDFGSASTGLCIGGSTTFFTNDTGKTWKRSTTPTSMTLNRVVYASPSRAFCVGRNGTILLSIDSGKSWKSITLETSQELRDVYFTTEAKGIICAANGFRLTSVDSGKSWTTVNDEIGNSLFAIDLYDGKNGAMCGELGAVYLTKDSAKTWQKQAVSPLGNCHDIIMLSEQTSIVVCDWQGIYRTTDGGATWNNLNEFGSPSLRSVSFASDNKNGVVVGSNGIILRTYNGSNSWEVVFDRVVDDAVSLNTVAAINSEIAVAGGTRGLIIKTTDGGKKWKEIITPTSNTIHDIDFPTPLIGFAVGEFGTILRTNDGGNTWHVQPSNSDKSFRGVSFLDTNYGMICGANATILKTTNGGKIWINITGTADSVNFTEIAYTAEQRAIIVGSKFVPPPALSEPYIVTTSNEGVSWQQAAMNVTGDNNFNEGYAVSFPTPAIGYASGSKGEGSARTGVVLKSLDSGKTWTLNSALGHAVYSMSFANAHSGTVVGLTGRTSHTSDGGASWVEVPSGTALNLNGVSHGALQSAFAVGSKTAIIRLTTNDTVVTLSAPATPSSNKHEILSGIYPNPSKELATFVISIEQTQALTLSLFDTKGSRVALIYDGFLPKGTHEANLDVSKLTPGIYFARLESRYGVEMMKLIVQ